MVMQMDEKCRLPAECTDMSRRVLGDRVKMFLVSGCLRPMLAAIILFQPPNLATFTEALSSFSPRS